MDEVLTLEFDGGSRGNPGPAGAGAVVRASDGTPLITVGRFIGRATNNVAEYHALITALKEARKLGGKRVIVRGDSELVIKQMKGEYRVKHPDLKPLYEQAQDLLGEFEQTSLVHNLRGHNTLADKLANLAMDRKGEVNDVDDPGSEGPLPSRSKPTPGGAKGSTTPGLRSAGGGATASPAKSVGLAKPPAVGDRFACPRCGCVVELAKPSTFAADALKPFTCQCGTRMI